MPNGRPRDHPLTDILNHKLPVYTPVADLLVVELVLLGGNAAAEAALGRAGVMWNMDMATGRAKLSSDEARALESELRADRDRLKKDAESRGWDLDSHADALSQRKRDVAKAWLGITAP